MENGTDYIKGEIGGVEVSNAVWTDEEIVLLANGMSPLMIRPANLVMCWSLEDR